jgi:PAS domain S-box-containing protein
MDALQLVLAAEAGLPHGWCLLWKTPLIWLHVVSDGLIALAYFAIPVALVYFVRKRQDVAFGWRFWLIGLFIFAGGTTHLLTIWTVWQPVYGLEGAVKGLTAAASVATAVVLMSLLPKALALQSPTHLIAANHRRQRELTEPQAAEAALRARVSQQAMVAELGQRALASADVDTLLNHAAGLVVEALDVDFCEILELQPDGQAFRLRAGAGWKSGSMGYAPIANGPQSQAGYTLLAGGPVVVEDLRTEARFTCPPRLHDHGVVSCISVIIQGRDLPFGVLGAHTVQQRRFTSDDINSLQAVAHVLALALERTHTEHEVRQLTREQAARAAAEAAQGRLALLADVSLALAASLEYEVTLEKITRLAVPSLADWCMVDILDPDGSLRRLPVAHADPTKAEAASRLQACPPGVDTSDGRNRVLRTGQSELTPEFSPERATMEAHDPAQLDLMRTLGRCSSMIVPLMARGQILGVMTLIAAESGRRYTPTDLPLAEELARRCAVALDNARLYQESQVACRDKDESLALLDSLLTSAPVGIAFFDRELRCVRINTALAAIIGLPMEAHLGRTPEELLPPLGSVLESLHGPILDMAEPIVNVDVSGETQAAGGQPQHWLVSCYPVRLPEGLLLGLGIVVIDITERRLMEERLQMSLQEKEVLLKEIHHRVKNNLQIISSLLDLQADTLSDPQVRTLFEDSQQRIQAMALIHESLYQSDDLAHIDAAQYIGRLCARLGQAYGPLTERVSIKVQAEEIRLEVQTAIACGLILQELLSNGLKYAFPDGRSGEIHIMLRLAPEQQAVLTVRDTGVGLPEELDFHTADSLGLQLVCLLTEQLRGTMALERNGGTQWVLTFPIAGV